MDAEHREETGAVAGLGFGVRGATFTPCAFASCWYRRSDRPKPDNPAPLGRPCRSRPLMTSFGRRVQKVGRSCCSPGTMPAADCRENGRARLPTFDLTVALLPRGHRFQLAISTPPSRLTAPSRLRRRPRLSDIGGPSVFSKIEKWLQPVSAPRSGAGEPRTSELPAVQGEDSALGTTQVAQFHEGGSYEAVPGNVARSPVDIRTARSDAGGVIGQGMAGACHAGRDDGVGLRLVRPWRGFGLRPSAGHPPRTRGRDRGRRFYRQRRTQGCPPCCRRPGGGGIGSRVHRRPGGGRAASHGGRPGRRERPGTPRAQGGERNREGRTGRKPRQTASPLRDDGTERPRVARGGPRVPRGAPQVPRRGPHRQSRSGTEPADFRYGPARALRNSPGA